MNISNIAGWVLAALGPFLAAIVFKFVRSRSQMDAAKAAPGAAALVLRIWFVSITDWLPRTLKTFSEDHGITTGVIASALAVVAGWIFVDVRQQRRRTVVLYKNWRDWLHGQTTAVDGLLDAVERSGNGKPAWAHAGVAAGARAQLMVQQQWIASTFTVFLMREPTEDEVGLTNGLTQIRRHGSKAIGSLANLETQLMAMGSIPLSFEDSRQLWKMSLNEITNLQHSLESHKNFVTGRTMAVAKSAGMRK